MTLIKSDMLLKGNIVHLQEETTVTRTFNRKCESSGKSILNPK